jgi:hypothetical protein
MKVRQRIVAALGALTLATLGLVAATSAPAFAAPADTETQCIYASGYSWRSYTNDTVEPQTVIYVFKGSSCAGSRILEAGVALDGTNYGCYILDDALDGIGGVLEMHGLSLRSAGNGHEVSKTVSTSSIRSPRNFWIYINSTQNTYAYNLPT